MPFLLNCQCFIHFIHFLLFNFQEAQNQDPAYLQGWIGQALLAETASYEDEAIDLFRHCTFLGMKILVVSMGCIFDQKSTYSKEFIVFWLCHTTGQKSLQFFDHILGER